MSEIDEFNPEPAPDYETLLFQFKATIRLYNSTRNQCRFMAKTICDMQKKISDGALDAVESERAANAQLTAELEALRQERDGLRDQNHALAARLDELCRVRNERDGLRAFVAAVAKQKPEKPDYWSACSQCESNISDAEDLIEAMAKEQGNE